MLQFSFESWIVDDECLATFLAVMCRLQRCALTRFLVQILYSCWMHVQALDVDLREVGIINFFRTSKGSSLLVQCLLNSKLVCCSLVFCSGLTCIVTECSSLDSCPCNVTHKLYVDSHWVQLGQPAQDCPRSHVHHICLITTTNLLTLWMIHSYSCIFLKLQGLRCQGW